MPEKNAISSLYTMVVSGGAFLIVSLTAYIVNRFTKSIDDNKISLEKEVDELKGQIKEQNASFRKDLGEAFARIRDVENIQIIIKTEHDQNHRRGKGNDK